MFLLKVNREGGVPSAESADTLDGAIELARQNLESPMSDEDWGKVKAELKSRRRWSDKESGVTMTITQGRSV